MYRWSACGANFRLQRPDATSSIHAFTRNVSKPSPELAGKLDAFHQRVDAYVSIVEWADTPSKEERRKLAADAFGDFNKYFRPRRFFLPEHTVKKIEDFRAELYKISIEFMLYVEQGREYRSDATKDIDVWSKASKYTTEEAPKLIKELEGDFRKILLDEPEMA